MISKIERIIAFRYLKPKKKEGFLKVISIFSFTGIALGVAILIIVMSVMDGFRSELMNKILGFNPHIIVKPYETAIEKKNIRKLEELKKLISDSIPDAEIEIKDLAGDENHYSATIKSKVFAGISKVEQHKIVYKALKGKMGNELHALSINTLEK